jgi:CDP-diacylglycerol--glycerol-3-phosphate 3-phosphatidyltransferase
MISTYQLKAAFQKRLQPIGVQLHFLGVTPNQVTFCTALISVLAGLSVAYFRARPEILLCLPFLFFLRMAMNAVDGWMAKTYNLKSDLGMFLNELGDLISDSVLFTSLVFHPAFSLLASAAMGLFVVMAFLSETSGILALQINAPRGYQGPMGKSDRTVWIGILALALVLGVHAEKVIAAWLLVGALLGLVTVINRVKAALHQSASSKQDKSTKVMIMLRSQRGPEVHRARESNRPYS